MQPLVPGQTPGAEKEKKHICILDCFSSAVWYGHASRPLWATYRKIQWAKYELCKKDLPAATGIELVWFFFPPILSFWLVPGVAGYLLELLWRLNVDVVSYVKHFMLIRTIIS